MWKKKKKKKYHSTTQPFFEKADWRKTRTRLQRMHNVSKRHIGGWNRDRELKEEWGGKKKKKKGQVYRLVAAADCNGRAIAAGTWIRALARARKENQQNGIRARERHRSREEGEGKNVRKGRKMARNSIGVDGLGERDRVKFHLLTFSAINVRLIFRHASNQRIRCVMRISR